MLKKFGWCGTEGVVSNVEIVVCLFAVCFGVWICHILSFLKTHALILFTHSSRLSSNP